jgi:SAM-dependent methyltransferase
VRVHGANPLDLYGAALLAGTDLRLQPVGGGTSHPLEVRRWLARADAADRSLLARCQPPTLDLGCGPGRLAVALSECGHPALGVDLSGVAVTVSRSRGAVALQRSIFDQLPAEGRWQTILLADGNVGIGGDPAALFRRTATLLAPGGQVLVEVESTNLDDHGLVRIEDLEGNRSRPFRWSRLGTAAAVRYARQAELSHVETWSVDNRAFLALRLRKAPVSINAMTDIATTPSTSISANG